MLSSYVFCSKFHLHRIFEASVGQPVMEYIRDKKLMRSVNQLLNTNRSIIDIAMEAGFDYQQSYTRAFKAHFGFTPSTCRKKRKTIEMMEKTNRLGYSIKNIKPDCVSGPNLITVPSIEVVGIEGVTTLEKEKLFDSSSVIPKLWERFFERLNEVNHILGIELFYGVCTSDWMAENNIGYMAAVSVSRINCIPPGMVARTIPTGKYAQFIHNGLDGNLLDSLDYIFGSWLLSSNLELSDEIDMVLKFENYFGSNENAVCEILVPIK